MYLSHDEMMNARNTSTARTDLAHSLRIMRQHLQPICLRSALRLRACRRNVTCACGCR